MAADDGLPQLRFASAAEWEQWLESNHDSAQGVWLKLAKKGSGIASVTRAETLDACLCFGWIDGRREALDDDYYLQRYTPRRRPNPRRRGADAIAAYPECRLTCLYGKRGDARRRAWAPCTVGSMPTRWPPLSYDAWSATCDTLHAHTQVLGKLAVELAPPEPELQHAALRLSARGWETNPLPAPDGSGAVVAALDLRTHEATVEHSDGRATRVSLTPNRPVAEVTREVLEAVGRLGGEVEINPAPQEVPWEVPLDEDYEHATYDTEPVATYLAAATQAALVLAEFRAPFRGRSTPVNAWWGTFDLAVNVFSGQPADPPSDDFIMRNGADAQQISIGWWPGDPKYDRAAFFAFAYPPSDDFPGADLSPAPARWDADLGEYVLDWEDVREDPDPRTPALVFARSAFRHSCEACDWDPVLAATAEGVPPPIR